MSELVIIYKVNNSNSRVIIPIKILDISTHGKAFTLINDELDKAKGQLTGEGDSDSGTTDSGTGTGITSKVNDNNEEFYDNIKKDIIQVTTNKIESTDGNDAIEYLVNKFKAYIPDGLEYASILWNDENPSAESNANNHFTFIENFTYTLDDRLFDIKVDIDATLDLIRFYKGTNYTYKPVFLNRIVNYTILLLEKNDEDNNTTPDETITYTWYVNGSAITSILFEGYVNEEITDTNNHKVGPITLKDSNGNTITNIGDTTKTKIDNQSSYFELVLSNNNNYSLLYIAFAEGTLTEETLGSCILNYNNGAATLDINYTVTYITFAIIIILKKSDHDDGLIHIQAEFEYNGVTSSESIEAKNMPICYDDLTTEDQIYFDQQIDQQYNNSYNVYALMGTTNPYATRVISLIEYNRDYSNGGSLMQECLWATGLESIANPKYVIYMSNY